MSHSGRYHFAWIYYTPVTTKENPAAIAIDLCAQQVRREDYARYALSLLVPRAQRPALWPVFALHLELKKIPTSVREPMMGLMRYQWWREAVTDVFSDQALHHPVLRGLGGLAQTIAPHRSENAFQALVDAHENAFRTATPLSIPQMVAQCDAIGLALQNLVNPPGTEEVIMRQIGGAYELAQALSDLPRLWVHGKIIDDTIDLSEIERVRLGEAELDAQLMPLIRQLAETIDSRIDAVKKTEKPLLLYLAILVTQRITKALCLRHYRILAFRRHHNDHLLVGHLALRIWFRHMKKRAN